MPIDTNTLRAYLDQALSPTEMAVIEAELAHNRELQDRLTALQKTHAQMASQLDTLAPTMAQPNARQALNRFHTHLSRDASQTERPSTVVFNERINFMMQNAFVKQYKSALVGLSVVLVVAILFSFAPVRSAAANFLTIFRVEQVKVVQVDASRIDELENNEELSGLLDQLDSEPELVTGGGDPQEVDSLDDAAGLVDFSVARVGALPDDAGAETQILVHEETVYKMNLDKELIEAIFDAAQIELSLPDSLDNEPIVVTKPDSIHQQWGAGEDSRPTLTFAQLRSPQIDHPDDLDLNALGVAVLQLLGRSQEEAEQLGQTIDWANTLLLPIPSDADVTATEVSINGANGVLFSEDDGKSGAMWQSNGMTYLLAGKYNAEQMLAIAQSVQ
ncbi:MAG: DUF4367 domain-containing protein [Chloroflexota bacterium]